MTDNAIDNTFVEALAYYNASYPASCLRANRTPIVTQTPKPRAKAAKPTTNTIDITVGPPTPVETE